MKGWLKIAIAGTLVGVSFLTPFSPLKAYNNIKVFQSLRSSLASFSDKQEEVNAVKKTFESSRSEGVPALFEPAEAVSLLSSVEGASVQKITVLKNVGATVKITGDYTESTAKEDIDALQFTVTTDNPTAYLSAVEKYQYLVETVTVSPSSKTVLLTINFSGGLNNE